MPQHRLQHCFTSSRARPVPTSGNFLDLPLAVRHLVYSYAGLNGLFIDLNYTNVKVYTKGTYPDTLFCRKLDAESDCDHTLRKLDAIGPGEVWELVHDPDDGEKCGKDVWGRKYGVLQSLLLVSIQIHREVEVFVYSDAVFRVCMSQPLGLGRLWRMSSSALSVLSSLTVRLDLPKNVIESGRWAKQSEQLDWIDCKTREGKTILKEWVLIVEKLAKAIRPEQLRLRIIFRAKTIEVVKTIIEPMIQLPRLKDCGIYVETLGGSR